MATKVENTNGDEALARLVFESHSTLRQIRTGSSDVFERVRRFIRLYANLTVKPVEAALLYEEAGSTRAAYREIGPRLTVGRLPKSQRNPNGADLSIEDAQLSPRHFEIYLTEGCYLVRDLESRNGTYLNTGTNRIEQQLLKAGDIILAGASVFVFTGSPLILPAKACLA